MATVSSYFLNRHWTWRARSRRGLHRELPLFVLVSIAGVAITTACLAVSHYLLGLHSLLADNVAKNGVGLLAGMGWRFFAFRRWVFRPQPFSRPPAPGGPTPPGTGRTPAGRGG